jgi:hypothetical protein
MDQPRYRTGRFRPQALAHASRQLAAGLGEEVRGLGLLLRQSLLFVLFMGMAASILMVVAGLG